MQRTLVNLLIDLAAGPDVMERYAAPIGHERVIRWPD